MKNSIYQKFTKNIIIIGLTQALMGLRGIILLPLLTKYLGINDYGIWIQLTTTISLFVPIIVMGLNLSLVRFLAGEKNKEEVQEGVYSVLFIVFILGSLVSLCLIILSNQISSFLGCENILIIILSLLILVESLNFIFLNILRAFQEIKRYCLFVIFKSFGEIVLLSIIIISGYKIVGAILSLLVINLILLLTLGGLSVKNIGFKFPNFSKIKKYLTFGIPTILGTLAFWIVQSSDRYMIGYILGTTFVGYYAVGYTLSNILMLLLSPLSFLLTPVLSKLYDENKIDKVKICLTYSLKYFLMIAIPFVFGLSALSKQLLKIFSTADIATQAYPVIIPVATGLLFFGGRAITCQILALVKKTNISATIWVLAAIVNLGLNFIFIPYFGILGAAITTLIAFALAFVLTLYYSKQYLSFKIDWRFIFKSVFSSFIMYLMIIKLNTISIIGVIATIILGAVVYMITLLIIRGIKKEEINFFKELLKKESSNVIS